jgi:hypothetical protein
MMGRVGYKACDKHSVALHAECYSPSLLPVWLFSLYVPPTLLEICCAYTFNTHRSRLLTRPLAILQLIYPSAAGLVLLPLYIVSTNTDQHQHLVPPPARYLRDPPSKRFVLLVTRSSCSTVFRLPQDDKSVSGRPG